MRRLNIDVTTLNPVRAASRSDQLVSHYLHSPLIYYDRNLQPAQGLAKSWTVSADGLVYRFELNEKASFSDGTPVRASDVVFTLHKTIDPKSQAAQISGSFAELDLSRTRAVNDNTVEIAFHKRLATQLTRFTDVLVIPEHVYSKGSFRDDFNDTAVGSGPYRLVKRVPGKEIILKRRTDYWRERPHIETVTFKVITDHGTAWNALKRGDIEETVISSETWLRERNNPALTRTIDFRRFYTLNYNFIAWNGRHPLFSDKRVRLALAMCVPVEAIIRDVYHGTARAVSGPFTPDDYSYNPSVPPIRYDLAEARRILAEAGWLDRNRDGMLDKAGKRFTFEMLIMPGSAATNQFAQMVQAEVKKIGIQLEIRTIDGAAQMQQVQAGNFESVYIGWELDPDPDPYSQFHSSQAPPQGQNFVFYSNAEADRLIDEARAELDRSKRQFLYWRLHEVLAEDQPYAWTIQVASKWAMNKRLRGVSLSHGHGLFLWYPGELGWWIAKDQHNSP